MATSLPASASGGVTAEGPEHATGRARNAAKARGLRMTRRRYAGGRRAVNAGQKAARGGGIRLPRGYLCFVAREDLERMWNDPANWTLFGYRCPSDPRVIVPKRMRVMGWTINWAH